VLYNFLTVKYLKFIAVLQWHLSFVVLFFNFTQCKYCILSFLYPVRWHCNAWSFCLCVDYLKTV